MIFLVTREGVYRHEIMGLRSTEEAAIALAKDCALGEGDDYHSFDVVEMALDGPCEVKDSTLFEVSRRDERGPRITVSTHVIKPGPVIGCVLTLRDYRKGTQEVMP